MCVGYMYPTDGACATANIIIIDIDLFSAFLTKNPGKFIQTKTTCNMPRLQELNLTSVSKSVRVGHAPRPH